MSLMHIDLKCPLLHVLLVSGRYFSCCLLLALQLNKINQECY